MSRTSSPPMFCFCRHLCLLDPVLCILQGATIQRVLRGNWQEDMLWQLHDVLISKRMLEHHALDSYIRTLGRC